MSASQGPDGETPAAPEPGSSSPPAVREEERPSRPRSSRERPRRSLARPGRLRALVHRPWFEPVLMVAVIAVLLGSLYAYTGNWPPLVVVESSSMQHGDNDVLGVINTGDLVLVKKVSVPSQVTTYVQGENIGYTTYGEYGDVLLYYPEGNLAATPVIHRAILWLDYDAATNSFSAPTLADINCGLHQEYQDIEPGTSNQTADCPTGPYYNLSGTLVLYNVGWQSVTVTINLAELADASPHTGFITMGDDNCYPNIPCTYHEQGTFDQDNSCTIACLVEPSWVEGVARGMIPWVGALKLWLSGDSGYVPPQTWDYLGATILVILLVPTVVPRLVRWMREPPEQDEEPPGVPSKDDGPSEGPEGDLPTPSSAQES